MIRKRSRLRTRIAASYVVVTMAIVLLLEALVVGSLLYLVTRSPLPGYVALQTANQAAQVMALQAALQGGGASLNAASTFDSDHPDALALRPHGVEATLSWFELQVPYVAPGAPAPQRPAVALLVGTDERVLASSYPDRFPAASRAAEIVGEDAALVRAALRGLAEGATREMTPDRYVAVARTVWSSDDEPIGAIYVRASAGAPPGQSLLSDVGAVLIPSSVLWLCLMLPVGLTFGFLATHGLIRRIEGLARATARFSDGDTAIRVPVVRADEIGQLEYQFNLMAEQLLESFAQRQALVEQSARREERARFEQEMSSALYIQRALLPEELPSVPGWQIEALYNPAQAVGGDLYDFLALPEGRVGIAIGDATGKGLPSALIMATTCATLRAAASAVDSPGEILSLVNNLLHQRVPPGTFATCFYAILDPREGHLWYANAGHNLPFLLRNGDVTELKARGMPLGLMPDQAYEEQQVTLASEDCLMFYSDGLVEAHAPDHAMYGTDRLQRRLQEQDDFSSLFESLFQDLRLFTGPAWEQEDDVTLITLRKNGVCDGEEPDRLPGLRAAPSTPARSL
jgi:serine phosphatase RsbU (regulator of sigma subunit)